jgi:predicted secreted Zn-dependent protease
VTASPRKPWLLAPVTALLLLAAACSNGAKNVEPTAEPTSSPAAVSPTPMSQATTLPVISATANTQQLSSDRIVLTKNTQTKYYTVTGLTTADIFDSIDKNGPRDDKGVKGSGLTAASWGYRWQPQNSQDGCIIASMTISLDIVVTLPKHANESSLIATLQKNWDQFEASVAKHEQTHVDIDVNGAGTIRDKMTTIKSAPSCDALSKQVDQLWNQEQRTIESQQNSFHSQEDARIAGLRAPLQTQIDTNRARISTLATQISGLDGSLATMKADLENVSNQLDALKDRIDAILAEYPSGNLPSDVFSQYEDLRRLYNALAPNFNQLVVQYNSAIAQRNQVADEHDKLVDATNDLVDRFNWTR